jgi:predicted DsbA family dithiol-disulfide isomerase
LRGFKPTSNKPKITGITGVPVYVVQNRYGISGAQDSEVFVNAFETVLTEEPQEPS